MIKHSFYSNTINSFIEESESSILGKLSAANTFSLEETQKRAWITQISILKEALKEFEGSIFFEYSIPRMGKRVDNIIIINGLIFVVEFKVGSLDYTNSAINQVMDYALDLKNFHEESWTKTLIPLLVATNAEDSLDCKVRLYKDKVAVPLKCNKYTLYKVIKSVLSQVEPCEIDIDKWASSKYKPTPTIIQAAQALYKNHDVKEISRSEGGAINLAQTTKRINEIIDASKSKKEKSICFVTGVPGAGKTLAGLNIATSRTEINKDEHAVFLSGNGPLVYVLREALIRDKRESEKEKEIRRNKKEIEQEVEPFIQNIHHFRDEYLRDKDAPVERVVVFDEAQRAWDKIQTSDFMRKKRNEENFSMSEPEFLISVMDRHEDWCTIICLIGGGQEINTGEAGLSEWLIALKESYPDWKVFFSNRIVDDENYLKNNLFVENFLCQKAFKDECLHLAVSMRSFRAERLSNFVESLLQLDNHTANKIYKELKDKFPIYVTRDLDQAKRWLEESSRGTERFGLLASAGGYRLRAEGIDVKSSIDVVNWFLNDMEDVRSSYYLEQAATQFDIQGLELDWTCVAWDIDLYLEDNKWMYRRFRGSSWQKINKQRDKTYLLNAYRVLLTRARQGMVIFVPKGCYKDYTRTPSFYNSVYDYLQSIGIPSI